MNEEWRWMLGVDASVATFCLGALIAAFRSLSATMRENDDALHSRINQVRDEYVRRIEFDAHFSRLREDFREYRDEIKQNNKRLDENNKQLSDIKDMLRRELE